MIFLTILLSFSIFCTQAMEKEKTWPSQKDLALIYFDSEQSIKVPFALLNEFELFANSLFLEVAIIHDQHFLDLYKSEEIKETPPLNQFFELSSCLYFAKTCMQCSQQAKTNQAVTEYWQIYKNNKNNLTTAIQEAQNIQIQSADPILSDIQWKQAWELSLKMNAEAIPQQPLENILLKLNYLGLEKVLLQLATFLYVDYEFAPDLYYKYKKIQKSYIKQNQWYKKFSQKDPLIESKYIRYRTLYKNIIVGNYPYLNGLSEGIEILQPRHSELEINKDATIKILKLDIPKLLKKYPKVTYFEANNNKGIIVTDKDIYALPHLNNSKNIQLSHCNLKHFPVHALVTQERCHTINLEFNALSAEDVYYLKNINYNWKRKALCFLFNNEVLVMSCIFIFGALCYILFRGIELNYTHVIQNAHFANEGITSHVNSVIQQYGKNIVQHTLENIQTLIHRKTFLTDVPAAIINNFELYQRAVVMNNTPTTPTALFNMDTFLTVQKEMGNIPPLQIVKSEALTHAQRETTILFYSYLGCLSYRLYKKCKAGEYWKYPDYQTLPDYQWHEIYCDKQEHNPQ